MENITNEIIENVTQKQPRGRPKTGFNKNEYNKKRYELNKDVLKEQFKENSKKYYQQNKDKIKENQLKIYNENKDILNEKAKAHQTKYREGFKLLENLYLSGELNSINQLLLDKIKIILDK